MIKKLLSLITIISMFPLTSFGVMVRTNCNNVPIQESYTSSKVIVTLPQNTLIEKLNSAGEFYQVNYNNINGWVNRAYTFEGAEEKSKDGLEIHFIDPNSRVDAIYIKCGDKSLFIDGGFYNDAKVEIAYLRRMGVKKIDYYIGTHAHSNHVGAAGPIIEAFNINTIYCGRQTYNGQNSTLYMMLSRAKTDSEKSAINSCKKVTLNVGNTINVNNLKITCAGPLAITNASIGSTAENSNSLILRMDYGQRSFLFAGDTGASQLSAANSANPGIINVDVYKNSHHNGALSSSVYKLISPHYVFFTTSADYLPSASYLSNIASSGAKYFIVTTNRDRNVLLKTDGNNININNML